MPTTEIYGGNGGDEFDDLGAYSSLGKIEEIQIRSGDWINAITVKYQGTGQKPETLKHGGNDGIEHPPFRLDADEYINRIEIGYGAMMNAPIDDREGYVNRLQFFTTKMIEGKPRSSPVYGKGPDHDVIIRRYDESWANSRFTKTDFPKGALLTAIKGRSGIYLNALAFVYDIDPVEYVVFEDLKFTNGLVAPSSYKPMAIHKVIATNAGDEPQDGTIAVKSNLSEKSSFSNTYGIKEGTSLKLKSDYPAISVELDFTLEATQSWSVGGETARTKIFESSIKVLVPPKSQREGQLVVMSGEFDAQFSATAVSHHKSGRISREHTTGSFKAVSNALTRMDWGEAEPYTGKDTGVTETQLVDD